MISSLVAKRSLILQLTKRDILGRYRGSLLGVAWSILTPLFMLAVYTLVFGKIFQTRWKIPEQGSAGFALILFCGLTAYNIFAETISRAPGIVVGNPNYIKKVVFPLEVLPVMILATSLVNAAIGFFIILITNFILTGTLHWTVVYVPIVLLPLILFSLGMAWFLSALGVFVRDIVQVVPILVTALMFLSPIFYPASALPGKLKALAVVNPIGYVVEDIRKVVLWGETPDWNWLILGLIIGSITAIFGYLWFIKTKKGFADVI
ncbi:MAG: ABC transporter permease [bacterium]|nr:ABC transporter permease [bacterium]